ncbi:MAG: hypothetical protein ACLFWL_12980 [Candidatus Brocadiia bacterium]
MTTGMNQQTKKRTGRLKLWQFFLFAILIHAIVIVGFSPSIYTKGEDTSPEGLIRKARKLAKEEKYEKALEVYEELMAKKPKIPQIFEEAEKEMHNARLKMLEKQREAAQKAKEAKEKAGEESEEGTDEKTKEEGADGTEEDEETEPETSGEDLPELPGLE